MDGVPVPGGFAPTNCSSDLPADLFLFSTSENSRQSLLEHTASGNWTGRDQNNCKSILSTSISGNYLQSKMSFSSIRNVNQELFWVSASSTSSNELRKQVRFEDSNLSDIEPKMTPKSDTSNNHIGSKNCDQNSNNNHASSVLSEASKISSSSLRSFGSQIDSTLRGSDYIENVRQHQHNYQQKQEHQSLNHHQQTSTQHQPEFQVWYAVQFRRLCQICLVMPLIGLVGCLIVACAFQFGDIQETACKVNLVLHNNILIIYATHLSEY